MLHVLPMSLAARDKLLCSIDPVCTAKLKINQIKHIFSVKLALKA